MKKLVSILLVICLLVFPDAKIAKADANLKLQSYNMTTADATNNISFQVTVNNTGSSSISLSDVTLRYYFTLEGNQSTNYACDYTPVGSSNVRGTFGQTSDSSFLELGFTSGAGSLAPGASIPMYIRIWKSDWTNFSQANDYSFNPSARNLTDADKMTAYVAGTLVWGREPGAAVSTPTPTTGPEPTTPPVPTTGPTATPVPTTAPNTKSAFVNIQAEDYDSRNGSNMQTFRLNDGGSAIGYIENGYSITFKNIDFGTGSSSVTFRAATQMNSTSIQIRSGSANGTLYGTAVVANTNNSWDSYKEVKYNLNSKITGVQDITLVFSGAVNVDYFVFTADGQTEPTATPTPFVPTPTTGPFKPTSTPTPTPTVTTTPPSPTTQPGTKNAFDKIEAEDYDSRNADNIETFNLSGGGSAIGYIENGNAVTYKNVDFGNGALSITANAATEATTSIQIRANSTSGTLLGTLSVGSTGSWDVYKEVSANITKTTGVKDIVLVFSGAVNLDYFKFNVKEVSGGDPGDITGATLKNTYGSLFGHMGTCINLNQLMDSNTLNVVKQQYNSITLENEMKPDSILGSGANLISVSRARELGYYIPSNYQDSMVPQLNFSTVDRVMQICSENNLGMRAHTLIWHGQTPNWFFRSNFNGNSGYVSTQVMDAREEFYVKSMINHVYNSPYGSCVYAWDVSNEHLHAQNSGWAGVYGNAKNASFVKNGFRYANDALVTLGIRDSVKLFYNDYNEYEVTDDMISLVNYINGNGKICDGVGLQSHLDTGYPDANKYKSAIQKFAREGFEIQITEFDATNTNASTQARYCYDIFSAILDCKKAGAKITGLTIWGLYDSISWRSSQNPLLFSSLTQPKESYNQVIKAYGDAGFSVGDITDPTPTPTTAPWNPTPTPTSTPTPTPTWYVTPTPTPVATPTPTPGGNMKEISDAYMRNISIATECPSNNSSRRANVGYGSVVSKTYYSTTTRSNRRVNIIVPANYNSSKKYPVLYVLHGIMGNEDSMLESSNHLVEIVANQVANGNAKEMIVVVPNMYASADGTPAGMDVKGMLGYDNFINDLVDNLMPFIAQNYSINPDRKYQAICGFSMGGREALFIGITRPDLFGYCMGIAPAPGLTPGQDYIANHPGQLSEADLRIKNVNDTPYAIMVCAGTNDSVVGTFPQSYHNILTRNNQNHIWYTIPGADHDSRTIQSGLNNFVGAIFHADN